jgi:hypothetical protein
LIKLLIEHPWTSIVELKWFFNVLLTSTRLLQILANIPKNNFKLVCHYNIFGMGKTPSFGICSLFLTFLRFVISKGQGQIDDSLFFVKTIYK